MAIEDQRVWYGYLVEGLYASIRDGAFGISQAKDCLIKLLTDIPEDGGPKPWQAFIIQHTDGTVIADTTKRPNQTFRDFVERTPFEGIGAKVSDIERLLADEPEALARLRQELTGPRGGQEGNENAVKQETNDNNVSIRYQSDLFAEPEAKPKPKRNVEQGNRRDYTLTRLKREAPELFAEVAAGTLTANAAALKAGFRRPVRTVPVDSPDAAIRALLRLFSVDDLAMALGRAAETLQRTETV